jgi:hypothetical protein
MHTAAVTDILFFVSFEILLQAEIRPSEERDISIKNKHGNFPSH